ncbi:hypothetical protein T01_841 [Trichinella spiralis]|uniref:Uncharacterized protein n=1 Tax=Trichinella spiralis TaxID=6334 RepID=A0A0V1AWC5_TRISP|nr:hypothetical protein T01_841 [Trichinella spiralis]
MNKVFNGNMKTGQLLLKLNSVLVGCYTFCCPRTKLRCINNDRQHMCKGNLNDDDEARNFICSKSN